MSLCVHVDHAEVRAVMGEGLSVHAGNISAPYLVSGLVPQPPTSTTHINHPHPLRFCIIVASLPQSVYLHTTDNYLVNVHRLDLSLHEADSLQKAVVPCRKHGSDLVRIRAREDHDPVTTLQATARKVGF